MDGRPSSQAFQLQFPYTASSTPPQAIVQVVAPDGISARNITLVLPSSSVALASLLFDTYSLSPTFAPTTYAYQLSIPGYQQYTGFTAVASDSQLQMLSYTVGLASGLVNASQPARPLASGTVTSLWGEIAGRRLPW